VRFRRRDSERRLVEDARPYFELSDELLATADPQGYFVRVTPVWERTLGRSADELVGRPLVEFVHADDYERAGAELRRLEEGELDAVVFESRFRAADGSFVWLEWRARRSPAEGVVHLVARDLTERRRCAEELTRAREHSEQASRAKSDFLSRMSHELRTPLTSVIGFSELLLRDGLAPDQELKLAQILKAGEHLLGLIDELLDIERVEAGTMTASPEAIQVGGLVRDALTLAGPQAAERDLTIAADLDECRDRYVMADPQRLRQALLNLLSNAIKYNREGGEVRVSADAEADTLRINVADTGPGLTDEQLRRLFIPFDRLGAEEMGVEGSGLGLVVSQRLVELMGGRLSASSEAGAGSTFTIELGLTEPPEEMTREPAPVMRSNGHSGSLVGQKALCIEDNPANLELVSELLGGSGAAVMTARDGRSGFDLARRERPDVILLDLNLPDLGGEQILAALSSDEALRDVPVIALSADASRDTMRDMYNRGIAAYVTKPFDNASLVESVERALKRSG
jgi:PAS domain S-box-containing protein